MKRHTLPLAFASLFTYALCMFETIAVQLKTVADKLAHLRRFL